MTLRDNLFDFNEEGGTLVGGLTPSQLANAQRYQGLANDAAQRSNAQFQNILGLDRGPTYGRDQAISDIINTYYNRGGTTGPVTSSGGGGGGGAGGGGGGGAPSPTVDLTGLKQRELDAARNAIQSRFDLVRTQLRGDLARLRTNFDFFRRALNDRLENDLRESAESASSRGILDSGVFLQQQADLQAAAADEFAQERTSRDAQVAAIRSQLKSGLLSQAAAEEASKVAEIERLYALAQLRAGR